MGMPITIEILDKGSSASSILQIFNYFDSVDNKFSTYKKTSEISAINYDKLKENAYSKDMQEILQLAEKTNQETFGYFNIVHNGIVDPSGVVKGWSIYNASKMLRKMGFENFYIDAGGDIQVNGKNTNGNNWSVGIKNPFNTNEIIKVIQIANEGVATSGNYIRGTHIYNPLQVTDSLDDIVSITVIGPNVLEADRFATAAFAMQRNGIIFFENLPGFEAYMIDKNGIATFTSGFNRYTRNHINSHKHKYTTL